MICEHMIVEDIETAKLPDLLDMLGMQGWELIHPVFSEGVWHLFMRKPKETHVEFEEGAQFPATEAQPLRKVLNLTGTRTGRLSSAAPNRSHDPEAKDTPQVGSDPFDTVYMLIGEIQGLVSLKGTPVNTSAVNKAIYQLRTAISASVEDVKRADNPWRRFMEQELFMQCAPVLATDYHDEDGQREPCSDLHGPETRHEDWCHYCQLKYDWEQFINGKEE